MEYVDQAIEYLRQGFGTVNDPKGLIIALAAVISVATVSTAANAASTTIASR